MPVAGEMRQSEWQQQQWWDGDAPLFPDGACVALDVPRDELNTRINLRVRSMFDAGWIDEVRRLRESPKPLSREASQALGYGEIGRHLDGLATLEETVAEIQLRSRQFAKRQLTWFRGLPGCRFLNAKLTFDRWSGRMSPQ